MTFDEFLDKCTACGGNWTAMILSGIKNVAPEVYAALPDASYRFDEACFIAQHLCSDQPHLRYCYSVASENRVLERRDDGSYFFREFTEEEKAVPFLRLDAVFNGYENK